MMKDRRLSVKVNANAAGQGHRGCPMCLVFIGFRIEGCPPVMIGANREESRRRPMTSPVCCRAGAGPGSLRCLLAGADHGPDGTFPRMGTWLGVNEAGLAVAVTNRSDGELAWEDQTRSKGLLAVDLLGFERPEDTVRFAHSELASGGFGGCNYLIAGRDAAFVVEAPGASRIRINELTPGIHAMTNLDVDDPGDARIRLVREMFDPRDFPASAAGLCRDERIVLSGTDRGTISSSLISIGSEIVFDHIQGDPRGRDYQRYRLPDEGMSPAADRIGRPQD
jgi:Transport and Golgi organisation 2